LAAVYAPAPAIRPRPALACRRLLRGPRSQAGARLLRCRPFGVRGPAVNLAPAVRHGCRSAGLACPLGSSTAAGSGVRHNQGLKARPHALNRFARAQGVHRSFLTSPPPSLLAGLVPDIDAKSEVGFGFHGAAPPRGRASRLPSRRKQSSSWGFLLCDEESTRVVEHIAGIDDLETAMATYCGAIRRWPKAKITLRQRRGWSHPQFNCPRRHSVPPPL
jgi:hypothetical protein